MLNVMRRLYDNTAGA